MSELESIKKQLSALTQEVSKLQKIAQRAEDRGAVENLFSKYMYYHNAFQDEQIIPMWVKEGTPGIHAQYTNAGIYNTYESVIRYHQGRPTPTGKLILHYTTTPVIEVAGDGQTAKGVWIMAGCESGLTEHDEAKKMPDFMFSPQEVQGKKVWAHWVWCKYAVDFLKQDGVWKIWKFRCFELARAPYEENWISFAEKNTHAFELDLMYFGDDGKPVFMPPADEKVEHPYWPYRPDTKQTLEPIPPEPYECHDGSFY